MINFEPDIQELSSALKKANGYIACEKLIIQSIKKYMDKGLDDPIIENYLNKASIHIEGIITGNQGAADCINYRYAGGFLNIILKTPSWGNWVKTIEI